MYKLPRIFVKVGEGRRVPLPVPGGGSVPEAGAFLLRTMEVERLITNGDLIESDPPPAPAPEPVAEPAAEAASLPADPAPAEPVAEPQAGDAAAAKPSKTAKGS